MAAREPAICIRTVDYSETSQVLSFLTRGAGLVRLIAKGAKRPKSKTGPLDLLSEGEIVYTTPASQAMGTLMEFSEATSHPYLRRDAERLHTAMYMLELSGEMIAEGDPHPQAYDLLHNSLHRLAEPGSRPAAVLAFYQWRLLTHVGLLGELTDCVSCGQAIVGSQSGPTTGVHFSSDAGGLLCRDCEAGQHEKLPLGRDTLAGLSALRATRNLQATRGKVTITQNQADAVNRLLHYHATNLAHKPLKLARHVIGRHESRR